MPYLIDTNVLSELRKGTRCHPNVAAWSARHRSDLHFISVLSLGEIRKGIEVLRRRSPKQAPAFEKWLQRLSEEYADCILPINEEVSERWGRLMAERTLPVIDGLLAATALEFGLTLATRNLADFAGTDVSLTDPFSAKE